MATHDYNIANGSGAAVRSDINAALLAISSNNSEANPGPTTTFGYQFWADTTSEKMYIRNSDNTDWIELFDLDGTSLPSSSATEVVFNDAGADLDFRIEGDTEANLFFIDAGNERVGIATNAPGTRLDVISTASASTAISRFKSGTAAGDRGLEIASDANSNVFLQAIRGSDNASNFQLCLNPNGGDVGIGETSPDEPLHITASDPAIKLQDSDGTDQYSIIKNAGGDSVYDAVNGTGTAGAHIFRSPTGSANERLRIDTSGRLLVGTSTSISGSGHETFELESSQGGHITLARDDGSVTAGDTLSRIRAYGNDGGSYQECGRIEFAADGTHANNDKPTRLVFSTTADNASSPTERMRITSGGFFKASNAGSYNSTIGTYHEFNNSTSNTAICQFFHQATTNPYGLILKFSNAAPDNNSVYFINCVDSTSTVRFKVHSDGDCDNHDNSYGGTSDEKLKQDIVDATSQWDDIKDLRIRKFKFKSDVEAYGDEAKTLIGVVAQEAETVSPGLIKNNPDLDDEGNDLGTVTKSVRYSVLYMKAVKALQEAMERIETLEAKVAALESA